MERKTILLKCLGPQHWNASVERTVNTIYIRTKWCFHLTAERAVFLHPHTTDTDAGVRLPSVLL